MLKNRQLFKHALCLCATFYTTFYTTFLFSQCTATLTSSDPTCFGVCDGTITATPAGGIAPYTFQWVDATGTSIGGNTAMISGLCAGSYGVNIVDASGVCSINDFETLAEPSQLSISVVTTDASCFGICDGDVQLTTTMGTSPYNYTWNLGVNGDQTGNASSICFGTYTVDVTDANGCSENIVYEINQPEEIIFQSITSTDAGCGEGTCEGSIEVSAIGANNYLLNGIPDPSGVFTTLCAGNYVVTAENDAGCTLTENVVIINEEAPRANFGILTGEMSLPDHELSVFNNSTNATSYEWSITGPGFVETTTVTEFSEFNLPYQGGNYTVSLVAFNATTCSDTASSFVEVRDEFTIWVPNSFTPDADEFNNTFEPVISDVDASSYDFYIFDRWGQLVFESHNAETGWDGTYNNRFVENGMYVWKIRLKSIHTDELREYNGNVTMIR